MNYRVIVKILGKIAIVCGVLMLLPVLTALIFGEYEALYCLLVPMAAQLILGLLMQIIKVDPQQGEKIYAKEGFVVVALSWVLMSLFAAIPYTLGGWIPSYLDAVFEMVSGFTTTGATILGDAVMIESLPRSLLLWRSFTHWIGGMGVLVFVMALLPQNDIRSIHLMRAEVPGPVVGKLVSHIRLSARILYGIYIGLSVLEFVLLLFSGMGVFDALIHTFSTAGTGGFSSHSESIAYFGSTYVDVVITVFMILFGVNFNLFFLLLIGNIRKVLKNEELRWYLGIVLAAIVAISLNIWLEMPSVYTGYPAALRDAAFQVGSVISTTGFVTADFNLWPSLSRTLLMVLLFIGGCAGSTGGGLKVSRIVVLFKSALHDIRKAAFPRSVHSLRMDGEALGDDTLNGIKSYFCIYLAVFLVSLLAVSLCNGAMTSEENFTAVATCLNNVGPGLGAVGPTGNFAAVSAPAKAVLILDMLAGRLEIFPLLVLVYPKIWKKK